MRSGIRNACISKFYDHVHELQVVGELPLCLSDVAGVPGDGVGSAPLGASAGAALRLAGAGAGAGEVCSAESASDGACRRHEVWIEQRSRIPQLR